MLIYEDEQQLQLTSQFDVQTQPDFLVMYYIASIIYSSLGNRTKKGEFQ